MADKKITVIDLEHILKKAVWIVEDHEQLLQGTGFFLHSWGFVTCAHCVGEKPFVYDQMAPVKKLDATVIAKNDTLNMALLSIIGLKKEVLPIAGNFLGEPESQDDMLLVGYPGFAPGKGISVKKGRITSFVMKNGAKRFNISASIVAGNSGGPVLDKQNRVIGIAVTGADRDEGADQIDDHGVILIKTLQHLAEGPAA